jgi:hypothetical protein
VRVPLRRTDCTLFRSFSSTNGPFFVERDTGAAPRYFSYRRRTMSASLWRFFRVL